MPLRDLRNWIRFFLFFTPKHCSQILTLLLYSILSFLLFFNNKIEEFTSLPGRICLWDSVILREETRKGKRLLSCRGSSSLRSTKFRAVVRPSVYSHSLSSIPPPSFHVNSMSMQSKRRPKRLSIIRYIRPGPQTHPLTTPSNPNSNRSLSENELDASQLSTLTTRDEEDDGKTTERHISWK